MSTKHHEKIVPNGWRLLPVSDVFTFVKSYAFSRDQLTNEKTNGDGVMNIHYGDIHSTFITASIDLSKATIPTIKDRNFAPGSESLLKDGDLIMADASEDYAGVGVTVSVHGVENKRVVGGLHTFVLRDRDGRTDEYFRQYIFRNPVVHNALQKIANGVSVYGISKTAVSKILLPLPPLPEQRRIVAILETWDKAIDNLKLEIKYKQIEKNILARKLITGSVRLPNFHSKWNVRRLGDLLDYEQPTKYLVKSTEYSKSHSIPVLTAGKTFILGYTDETIGIFTNLPVIIFDDFTTANKFVTFPFKAKSSAMKMLKARSEEIDLRFVFEKMQLLNFQPGEHKRYWISEYQEQEIEIPEPAEQRAIASILTKADEVINLLEKKRANLESQKLYLLNALMTGATRTLEN